MGAKLEPVGRMRIVRNCRNCLYLHVPEDRKNVDLTGICRRESGPHFSVFDTPEDGMCNMVCSKFKMKRSQNDKRENGLDFGAG